jgi:hypothetical protein
MGTSLFTSIRSEWLKTKRNLLGPLVLGSAWFIPLIILAVRFRHRRELGTLYRTGDFWQNLWTQSWESMALLILPMFIMLVTSLIVQIETRNNTWKQLHASPQAMATIFLAKLTVILVLVAELFVLFNVAIYVTGVLPAFLFDGVPVPAGPIPYALFLERNARYFVDILPIVGLQYLLSLHFRSFIAPLGAGMAMWIVALGGMNWEYSYVIPYTYCGLDYLITLRPNVHRYLPASLQLLALGTFLAFTIAGFTLYARKEDRG